MAKIRVVESWIFLAITPSQTNFSTGTLHGCRREGYRSGAAKGKLIHSGLMLALRGRISASTIRNKVVDPESNIIISV